MFTLPFYRTILKAGLFCGLAIVLFSFLKSEWYFTGSFPDLYITLVALVFITAGYLISKKIPAGSTKPESISDHRPQLILTISKRELTVLQELFGDLTNKEIASKMCIELSTLKTHINSIYRKLEVKNRVELRLKYKPDDFLIHSPLNS